MSQSISATDKTLQLTTPILPGPIRFKNCADLAHDTLALLRGWQAVLAVPEGRREPFLGITRKRSRFHWESKKALMPYTWARHKPRNPMGVLCEIHYELSDWFVELNPGYFCLHCAGVRIGRGIVIFPSDQRSGKSVLTIQFAERGHEIFGDDVVAITPRTLEAYSLGLLPRLRLPYPQNVDESFVSFINARPGPCSERYWYVALRDGELAPLGRTAPIKGFVLLERLSEGEAALEPISQGEVLKHVIRKNFATDTPVLTIFNRLKRLTGETRRYRLRYSNGSDAIALLCREFGG